MCTARRTGPSSSRSPRKRSSASPPRYAAATRTYTTSSRSSIAKILLCEVPELPEVLPVPGGRYALTRRVGPRGVAPRSDAQLAALADVPVLAIGAVPELLGVRDVVARRPGGIGVHHPLAYHPACGRAHGPDRVVDRVVGVQAEHHAGEQRVVERPPAVFLRQIPKRQRARASGQGGALVGRLDLH